MENYIEINSKKIVYKSGYIKTSNLQILYADYIASGRPSPLIEKYLETYIYPYYSNTNSNANNGIFMKDLIKKVKYEMRNEYNLSSEYKIIFTGTGTTGAINHLINCIDYSFYNNVYIFLSNYEHYSNHLPWIELKNSNKNIKIKIIPFNEYELIDLEWFENNIQEIYNNSDKILIITSIINCSNVNGLFLPTKKIKNILDKYQKGNIKKYFFSDYACSAPYIKIDGSCYDAFFYSPHKFIGGTSTPGVLIAKNELFTKNKPFCPGGGCLIKVLDEKIIYNNDIEKKEMAGTPNIIGIIRIGKIIALKNYFQDIITNNEHILSKIIKKLIIYLKKKYTSFNTILYEDDEEHLPILSFYLSNLHYNFIVKLLNDLYGIQSRGGISCAGLLADYIKEKYNVDGWVRLSFHWIMSRKDVFYIIKSLIYIIENGHNHLKDYIYDDTQNLFYKI